MRKINHILIIDDDRINNFVCSKIIGLSGIANRVDCELDAREALIRLKQHAAEPELLPDLIFLDINMPGMNGWEFLEEYRALKPILSKAISILMLSSSLYTEDIERSRSYPEVVDYVIKPLTLDRLHELHKLLA